MNRRFVTAFLCVAPLLSAAAAIGQMPVGGASIPSGGTAGANLRYNEQTVFNVFGKVRTLKGDPVPRAKVEVKVIGVMGQVRQLETNLQGEFRTEFKLSGEQVESLTVNLTASKEGFLLARETVDFGKSDKTWEIQLTMREPNQDPAELSQDDLISSLAPRLRKAEASNAISGSSRKDLTRGVHELLDQQDAARALPFLSKVAKHESSCVECRELLGLAELEAGSWDSATRDFAEAAKVSTAGKGPGVPEPLFTLGVLESWRHEQKKAAGFFMEALKIAPKDPLVLQELGRVLMLDQNWEAADEYLLKATQAGASPAARLLRVEALLGEGDPDEASREMGRYMAGQEVKDLPLHARQVYAEVQDRLQLEGYQKVKSVAKQSIAELNRAVPELKGIEPAATQEQLPSILHAVGEDVEAFFRDFPSTVSVEQIHAEQLRRNGKVSDQLDQKFRYLLLTQPAEQGLGLEEYRGDSAGNSAAPVGLQAGFMITKGFASLSLIFHPQYQPESEFRYLGQQVVEDRKTDVVAFAQKPELARIRERFNLDEDSVLILIQGVVWIDSSTHQIVRMRTDLLKPQPRVRLERQTTEIQFGEVRFKEKPMAFWLPREVVVTVELKGKTYRNLHQYTDFRLFTVGTEEKRKPAVSWLAVPATRSGKAERCMLGS